MPNAASPEAMGLTLIERTSPAVRRLLVKWRTLAMQGGVKDVLASISEAIRVAGNASPRDVVAMGMLYAELLHLELLHRDALEVMERIVSPNLASLTAEERFGVKQNFSDIQFRSFGRGTDLFYNVVDQRRLAHFEWLDYHDLLIANQDAERGKHYETLPILWQQLRRAYLHLCWLPMRWTSQLFARECAHLKEWGNAVHHAILAGDEELVTKIAGDVLTAREPELVESIVSRVLTSANLRAHFVLACKLLCVLEDAIPDRWIPRIGDWALVRAGESRVFVGADHVSAAWDAIAAIGQRFDTELARSAIATAVTHPAWTTRLDEPNRVIPERRAIIRAVLPLSYALPAGDLLRLSHESAPLALERRQMHDYNDSVNLLCHLATRGGATVKEHLAEGLYQPDKPVSRVLAIVADVFGRGEVFDTTKLRSLADQVGQELRRQVQRLQPGQMAEPVAEQVAEYTSAGGSLKVYLAGLSGLQALARHRSKLDEPTIQSIVGALLDMIRNRDNFCANRASLLQALIEFEDVAPSSARAAILAAIEPLARGIIEESSDYPTAQAVADPLNPMNFNMGTPEDVQQVAIVAFSAFADAGDRAGVRRLQTLLGDVLVDHRPAIRKAGYAAASRVRAASEGVILGVLSGLRDPDGNAAVSAFASLSAQTDWKLTQNHWRMFLMSARLVQRSGGAKLRRHAASALVAWSERCPRQLQEECADLVTLFSNDICRSVRAATERSKDDAA